MTPEEAWNGRKPAVDHFKIFGCRAYAKIPDENRKKLDDKGEKCVFLGQQQIPVNFDDVVDIIEPLVQSSDVDHTNQQPLDGNLLANDPIIEDQPRFRKRPAWMIDYVADILTKPLKSAIFVKLRKLLGVCSSKEAA
ncbi:hypothetical protein MRB53_016323 [Persea americana]|uniref:Uncharacterized protein n=1 Tax=Persea americana TaxID=3435 RepID=A0ACC2M2U0_PERAE|nr:hypothetical protein MRB53_016323 [Persea americana]